MTYERLDAALDEASIDALESPLDERPLSSQTVDPGSTLRHTLVLGTIIALGALGIDTYLPAFPAIAASLGVDEGSVQLSLVSYFLALAVGQTIYGPLSDRIGRRPPLLFGFAVFVLGSVGAALSSSIEMLVGMRFIQGLGACGGMVIPRAVVRDVRSGEEAARLFALMLLVLGVSPILAPLLGSLLLTWLPWQADFWFLAGFGLCCLTMTVFFLEETNPPFRRTSGGIGKAFRSYGRLLVDRWFMTTVLIGGFSQAVVFA
jgi:DHA1 family bicyclomycin/chloramphenicol resistance-like MFS transporter